MRVYIIGHKQTENGKAQIIRKPDLSDYCHLLSLSKIIVIILIKSDYWRSDNNENILEYVVVMREIC